MESSRASSIGKLALIFLGLFILVILLAYNASAASIPEPISYWKLDSNNNTEPDSISNNHLSYYGSPVFTDGIIDGGYDILGSGGASAGTNLLYDASYSVGSLTGKDVCISFWRNYTDITNTYTDIMIYSTANNYLVLQGGNTGDTLRVFMKGTTTETSSDSSTISIDNTLHHYVVCYYHTDTDVVIWEDGAVILNDTSFASKTLGTPVGIYFNSNWNFQYGTGYESTIDEIAVFDIGLRHENVTALYNNRTGCQHPFNNCDTSPNNTTLTLTAVDDFNSTAISDFSINATWANGTTETWTTSTGTYVWVQLQNASTTVNLTFWNSTDYFNYEVNNIAVTANSSNAVEASMYQAVATLTATEKITGSSLSGVTFYIGSKSGTEFNLTAGTHSVTAEKAGYYNLTGSITVPALSNTTYNLEGMYNSIINFTAYNALTNATVSSFTISLDFGEEVSTTNGTVFINAINNTNYTFNITSPGAFTSRYNLSFVANASVYNVNTSLFTFNSIRFNIFNETSGDLITQLVTLNVIDSENETSANTTTTGFISLSLLQPQDYEIRFESLNFNPRSIFLTVTNDSTQNISVYMTENTTTELQVIEVLNTANQPIEGAIVWLQKEQLNSSTRWLTIQEAETDYAGKTSVFIERDVTVFYRFAVIYEGEAKPIEPSGNLFTGKTSFIPGIEETIQLIIDLQDDPEDFISDALAIAVNCSLDNITVSCLIVDGRNSITGAVMRIEASYINESLNYESIANVTFTGSSGTLEYNLTEVNNSIWRVRTYLTYETSESLVWETIKRFDIDVIIEKNLGIFYAALLLAVCFALTVGLGPLPSGLISFAVLIPLTYIKILSLPVGVITGLLALVIIFFFRTRKLDE